MKKINIKNLTSKSYIAIINYILCLLVIETLIIMINLLPGLNKNEATVMTEISEIKSNDFENDVGNFKVKVLEYDKLSYYIKVNCANQTVTVYTKDDEGKYTIPIKRMICSTGTSTPSEGVFEISDKYKWRYLVGNVYGQYATRITGSILFHSVPYTHKDKSTLEYWEYDKLGQPVSRGCVRLTVEDAKWIFDYCKCGTEVEFCNDESQESNSIIKTQMKISGYSEELRNWDPTDPDPNNPWLSYKDENEGENN